MGLPAQWDWTLSRRHATTAAMPNFGDQSWQPGVIAAFSAATPYNLITRIWRWRRRTSGGANLEDPTPRITASPAAAFTIRRSTGEPSQFRIISRSWCHHVCTVEAGSRTSFWRYMAVLFQPPASNGLTQKQHSLNGTAHKCFAGRHGARAYACRHRRIRFRGGAISRRSSPLTQRTTQPGAVR